MDNLTYVYSGNRLNTLTDSSSNYFGYPDTSGNVIGYDNNGNMTDHVDKGILEIKYNYLNLPEESLKNYKIDILLNRDINQSPFINSKKLGSDPLCIVVPDDHDFKSGDDITKASLSNQKFILTFGGLDSSYDSLLMDVFKHYEINPESYISSQFGSTIISLIKKGLGISMLPQSYNHYDHSVRFISLPFYSDLYINWRKDDPNIIIKNIMDLI